MKKTLKVLAFVAVFALILVPTTLVKDNKTGNGVSIQRDPGDGIRP